MNYISEICNEAAFFAYCKPILTIFSMAIILFLLRRASKLNEKNTKIYEDYLKRKYNSKE